MTELVRQMSLCSERHTGRKINFDQEMYDNLEAVVRDVSYPFTNSACR